MVLTLWDNGILPVTLGEIYIYLKHCRRMYTYREDNVCTGVANCLCTHASDILVELRIPSCEATRETKTKITLTSAQAVHHDSIYIILFLTRHNKSLYDGKHTILIHQLRVSLALFTFCWWRHNLLLMTSQCNRATWQFWRSTGKWYITR